MRRAHALPHPSVGRSHKHPLATLGWTQFAIVVVVIGAVILIGSMAIW